jgi:hypothetical protein
MSKKALVNPDLDDALGGGVEVQPIIPRRRVRTTGRTNLTYYTRVDMHLKLRRLAADHNTSMQQLVDEAVGMLFAKYGLGQYQPWKSQKTQP